MLIAAVPLFVALAGLLIFALTKDKASEVGRILLFVGLFWSIYTLMGETVRIH